MLVDEAWLTQWTHRLRALPGPPVLAVYLRGSHAQGIATRYSDVDFDVLVDGPPQQRYPAWLVAQGERLRHVSVSVTDVAGFLDEMAQPAKWSFGWPVRSPIRPLWTDPARPDLVWQELTHPQGEPLLEDAMEDFAKICHGLETGNDVLIRVCAADLAREVPTLLRLANAPRVVANRSEAWAGVLSLQVKPPGYDEDMALCLGWKAAAAAEVAAAAHRLIRGTVGLVRPYAHSFEGLGDLGDALRDGRLERYLAQLAESSARTPPS